MKKKRKYLPPRVKHKIKKAYSYICQSCKQIKPSEELEIDHIKAFVKIWL